MNLKTNVGRVPLEVDIRTSGGFTSVTFHSTGKSLAHIVSRVESSTRSLTNEVLIDHNAKGHFAVPVAIESTFEQDLESALYGAYDINRLQEKGH